MVALETRNLLVLARDAEKITYLHRLFPWFTHEEILAVIDQEGNNLNRVMTELDRRSGNRNCEADAEF